MSWSGTITYYFGVGDSQETSFGAHTHGFASGLHPLPPSFSSKINDFAIYHQRLTTDTEPHNDVPVVSTLTMVILPLLLLAGSAIVILWRRPVRFDENGS